MGNLRWLTAIAESASLFARGVISATAASLGLDRPWIFDFRPSSGAEE